MATSMIERIPVQIVVTPEMIEAGVLTLCDYDPRYENQGELVEAIFRIMLRIACVGTKR